MISERTRNAWALLDQPVEVYEGRVSDAEYIDIFILRLTLKRFRAQWDGVGDWGEAYLRWIQEERHKAPPPGPPPAERPPCGGCTSAPPTLPPQSVPSFFTAVVRWLRSGAPLTQALTTTWRLRVCAQCDRLISKVRRCSICGCFVGLKARMKTEHCPIGKW